MREITDRMSQLKTSSSTSQTASSTAAAAGGSATSASSSSSSSSSSATAATTAAPAASASAATATAAAAPASSAQVATLSGGGSSATSAPSGTTTQQTPQGERTISYSADRIIDNGSFGVVFLARVVETGETVAIKKVLQDRRFKNRELQIMQQLKHPNVVELKHCFYSSGTKADDLYLNLVLEYVPETVHKLTRSYVKKKQSVPLIVVKLYMYQLCRALAYTHALGMCHRDIKPQNLLVDPSVHVLKLCDFGSAKLLARGEPNVSYICSRYYRAPELIFGATDYTTAIDVWSAGCVCAEMMLGQPLFPGDSGVDQLVEIIKVLGTPTREEIYAMNPNYTDFKFPQIAPSPWSKVLRAGTPPEAVDFVSKLLSYTPTMRLTPLRALLHPFFDELRRPDTRLPSGGPLPALFNFTDVEYSIEPAINEQLVPEFARTAENWPPRTARIVNATPSHHPAPASSSSSGGSAAAAASSPTPQAAAAPSSSSASASGSAAKRT